MLNFIFDFRKLLNFLGFFPSILLVSSSSCSHPFDDPPNAFSDHIILTNNIIYKGFLATAVKSKILTQQISWPHGDINRDNLAPLGNYMDKKGHHLLQLEDHLTPLDICMENLGINWEFHE